MIVVPMVNRDMFKPFCSHRGLLGWVFGWALEDLHWFYRGLRQRDPSMRALWSDRQICSHNLSQQVKRIKHITENRNRNDTKSRWSHAIWSRRAPMKSQPKSPLNLWKIWSKSQLFKVPEGHHPRGTTLREALRGNLPLRGLCGGLLRGLCEVSCGISAGFCGGPRDFPRFFGGSDPILVTLGNCWTTEIKGAQTMKCTLWTENTGIFGGWKCLIHGLHFTVSAPP